MSKINFYLFFIVGIVTCLGIIVFVINEDRMHRIEELKLKLEILKKQEHPYISFGESYNLHRLIDVRYLKQPTVEEQIVSIAESENFKWPDYLVRLAMAESSLNPNAININKNGTKDRGVFQINNYWHDVSDDCAMDIDCATRWTIQRINAGYQHEWVCDELI